MTETVVYAVGEAARVARIGRTSLYEEIATGRLRAVKRGRRTLILAQDLKNWLETLKPVQRKRLVAGGVQ
jgi:excisionase family DNA binding protein